jgi:hypothetical protein
VVEHPLGKGEVVSSILTGSTMFVGFFQCHASSSFAERRGTMREHAAVWTQIGHTKSRSVHRFDFGDRSHTASALLVRSSERVLTCWDNISGDAWIDFRCRVHGLVLRPPFWAWVTHVMQFWPIRIEERGRGRTTPCDMKFGRTCSFRCLPSAGAAIV